MAAIDFGNNSGAPDQGGAVSSSALLAQDALLQAKHPSWPTGGTAAQLGQETSGYDNSAVSPKGAQGIAQVMPDTLKSIEAQTGRKLDPNNVNDQLFIHRYIMDQNLARYNGDPSASVAAYNSGTDPSKWNNPETNNYTRTFDAKTGIDVDSPYMMNAAVQPTTPQQAQPAQNSQQPAIDFGPTNSAPPSNVDFGDKPVDNSLWENLKGLGMQAANIVGGGLESIPIAAHAAYEGLRQGSLGAVAQTGAQDFSKYSPESGLNALGVNTDALHNTAGYQLPAQAMNFAFDTVPGVLGEGLARTGELEAGMSPSQFTPEAAQQGKNIVQAGMILSPLAEIPHAFGALTHGGPSEAELAAQKFANHDNEPTGMPPATTPGQMPWEMGPQPEGGGPLQGQPNAGPERPPIAMNSQGIGIDPLQPVTAEMNGAEQARNRMGPNEGPQLPEGVDPMAAKVADFNTAVQSGHMFSQGDLFNDLDQRQVDQYGTRQYDDEELKTPPRPLNRDEFDQTLENLASQVDDQGRPKTGFELPEPDDRDAAYDKYLETVTDKQGGLLDRPTIADNFAKAIDESIVAERVANHPAVKAAQNEVNRLQDQIAATQGFDKQAPLQQALQTAKDTLAKATANVTKFFKDSFPKTQSEDGITYLHAGLRPPDWLLNGIGNMLKAFHGLVFRQAAKLIRKPTNLDSFAKIVRSGIADRINREVNRNWETEKNGNAVDHIQSGPLGKFDAIKEWIPDDRPYEELKQDFMGAPDMDSNMLTKNMGAQGGLWASAISKNPMVKYAYTKINGAQKAIDLQTKMLLTDKKTGLQAKMRALTAAEKGEIYAHMDLNEGKRAFTDAELQRAGFNDRQIDYYRTHQEVMGKILDQVNDARSKIGLDPIDPRIAYMSSRFVGDFRSLVYQKGTGHIVGFIGHNYRPALRAIIRHIDEQNPGKYDFEKPTLNKPDMQHPMNMFQGYMNALDMLSKTDSDVKAIVDSYRSYLTSDAAKMLGALKHAKEKEGIFGAEGKKAWENQKQNADQGMKSQLSYAENMIKWSNMQDAATQLKQMLSDPDLQDKPNAKSYVTDYLNNALGHTRSAMRDAMNGLLNGVANIAGVGPSVFRGMNNFQKSALLQMWLGFFRIPHAMLTLTQFFQSNPAFARMVNARGIDDVHFWSSTLKGTSTAFKMMQEALGRQTNMSDRERAISDYNKKNQVFAVNLKDHLSDINNEGPISRFMPGGRLWNAITEANITYPELALRSVTFSTWAHALADSGMPLKEALGTAENFTRGALVDYRPIERPLIFGKMGFMGDIASTLTRFKANQLSQHVYFGKNAIKQGDITPLATLLGTSIAFAGASGLLGFAEANELYREYSKWIAGKPDTLKAVFLRNLPDWANYGLFSQLGINMQGSYSNADTIPSDPLAAMFPTGSTLTDMAKSVGELALHHDKATAKQVLYNFSPTSLKGVEENYMFSQPSGTNGNVEFHRPGTDELQSIRNPTQQMQRNFAFHPFQEARNYDVANQSRTIEGDYSDLRDLDMKRLTDIMQSRQPTQAELQSFNQSYFGQHRGTPQTMENDIMKFREAQKLTQVQRAYGVLNANPGLQDLYRRQDLQNMKLKDDNK
jgi:hypothetical protein